MGCQPHLAQQQLRHALNGRDLQSGFRAHHHLWGVPQHTLHSSLVTVFGPCRIQDADEGWEMSPESITICQAPDDSGRLWELGSGGFGVVYKVLLWHAGHRTHNMLRARPVCQSCQQQGCWGWHPGQR